jgi:hypothetical protein
MRLFKKRKKEPGTIDGDNKVAGYVANGLLKMQAGWAGWMQRQSEKLGTRGKKIALIACCLFTMSYSTIVIIKGIQGKTKVNVTSKQVIKPPIAIPDEPETGLSKPELNSLKKFRQYLDSLKTDTEGRKVYDSLVKARPGLIDSLAFVEDIYQLR